MARDQGMRPPQFPWKGIEANDGCSDPALVFSVVLCAHIVYVASIAHEGVSVDRLKFPQKPITIPREGFSSRWSGAPATRRQPPAYTKGAMTSARRIVACLEGFLFQYVSPRDDVEAGRARLTGFDRGRQKHMLSEPARGTCLMRRKPPSFAVPREEASGVPPRRDSRSHTGSYQGACNTEETTPKVASRPHRFGQLLRLGCPRVGR